MSDAFQGRKLLVLGGTSGMGLETARLVLGQGGSAVIVGHDAGKAEAARAQLAPLGPVQAITADLGSDLGVAALREVLSSRHGDIDLLVNAAGVFFPKPFLDHEAADYERYMALNKAFFFITQAMARQWVGQKRPGAIVNIGSMWARQAIAATPSSAYSMAKAGLHALTQHLAMELAPHRIRVNAVSPAVVETPVYERFIPRDQVAATLQGFNSFHPIGRVGRPQDVAEAIAFLAQPGAAGVSGQVLRVCGQALLGA